MIRNCAAVKMKNVLPTQWYCLIYSATFPGWNRNLNQFSPVLLSIVIFGSSAVCIQSIVIKSSDLERLLVLDRIPRLDLVSSTRFTDKGEHEKVTCCAVKEKISRGLNMQCCTEDHQGSQKFLIRYPRIMIFDDVVASIRWWCGLVIWHWIATGWWTGQLTSYIALQLYLLTDCCDQMTGKRQSAREGIHYRHVRLLRIIVPARVSNAIVAI